MSTSQMDCPWCGCGWLISCSECRKAFTYGVIKETDSTLLYLARREATIRGIIEDLVEADLCDWADSMDDELSRFEVGEHVVYFDGCYFPVTSEPVQFNGLYSEHDLECIPHWDAMTDPHYLDQTLGNQQYWRERKLVEISGHQ